MPARMPEWVSKTLQMSISDFVQDAGILQDTDSADKVPESLANTRSHVVLVVREGSRQLTGVITPTDLSRYSGAAKVSDVASKSTVVAVLDDAQLGQALELMNGGNSAGIDRLDTLPVVDAGGNVKGVLTRDRIKILLDKITN